MKSKVLYIILLSLHLLSCQGKQNSTQPAITSAEPIQINRFDKVLFQFIESNDPTVSTQISQNYPQMLEILGKGILNMQSSQEQGFFEKLLNYYTEPTLKGLYADAIQQYENLSQIEQDLGNGFAWLKACLPNMPIPAVYMHVSGFNQNVLVGDSLLSISIDKYLGTDYPLYQNFFYDYQRRLMTPLQVVSDYLTGWLMSEYPFEGKENVLLDRMIYEGKIKFIIQQALPELSVETLMGYTESEVQWCKNNEAPLWRAIVERKHLYTPDQMVTSKYFDQAPCTFLSSDTPGNIGTWMGWQIIKQYMEKNNTTIEALMQNNDSQSILTASHYKP
ncbi:MAG: gliding motility lipoprotein GldB [Parabacteroides sp.]|nr:gliding motility lipoprotein GldB [Parabacteroides sp.]